MPTYSSDGRLYDLSVPAPTKGQVRPNNF